MEKKNGNKIQQLSIGITVLSIKQKTFITVDSIIFYILNDFWYSIYFNWWVYGMDEIGIYVKLYSINIFRQIYNIYVLKCKKPMSKTF